jgi:hypothetical protein
MGYEPATEDIYEDYNIKYFETAQNALETNYCFHILPAVKDNNWNLL